ncbi:hypothetical protein ACFLXA_05205 [Chloroflexota bacterium]
MSKIRIEDSYRRTHGSVLCWLARAIALLPVIVATTYIWIDSVWFASKYGTGWEEFIVGIFLLCFLVLPGLIAWRWHLLGGIILALESAFHIFLIDVSIASHDVYLYFELDRYIVLRIILPFWIIIFIGASLHLFVWWEERRRIM